ncbi:unnamed protein product [Brassica rapa]|uniref:Uncharacterized protein n=1 Tax=Brassica campestris TaxID=3711 RepID=A0A3P5YLP9_BRACM|nr:unnamed protein product [Brassica rapa]VDC63985.1 unnamed protein product [Brassica rapa]
MFDDAIEVDGGSEKKINESFWFESTFLLREDLELHCLVSSICEIWKRDFCVFFPEIDEIFLEIELVERVYLFSLSRCDSITVANSACCLPSSWKVGTDVAIAMTTFFFTRNVSHAILRTSMCQAVPGLWG